VPGLHSPAQVDAWRTVTDAVHAEDGVIFAQLMHSGRIGHPDLLPDGLVPVAIAEISEPLDDYDIKAEGPCGPAGHAPILGPHSHADDSVRAGLQPG
jgi:N-ethylmaleimide reductase